MESKNAATDATINTVRRDNVRPIVVGKFDDYSTDIWHTAISPEISAVFAYAWMVGFGGNGRRTTWLQNDTGTRYIQLQARWGTAAVGWRGFVRNPGA